MNSAASPETFFGSKEYFQGARLNAQGYTYVDALTIQHNATGIKMWSCAIDIREKAGQQGLQEGDRVLFHYTTEGSFKKITSLENPKLLAPLDESNTDSYFGLGIYATKHAPHQWKSKEEVLVNNYYPTGKNFRSKQGLDLPQPDVLFNTALNGAVGQYVKDQYKGKADCCIPLIVDEQVSKNVMEEITDGPLMPNGRKRLKGRNCDDEEQPFWRDVWLVSIYKQARAKNLGLTDAVQSPEKIVEIFGKRLETDELVQELAKYGIENYREIRKKLLVKVIEVKPKDSHAYHNLGTALSPEETVQVQMQTGPRRFNKKELFLETINLDNSCAHAYHNLGTQLSPDETVTVHLQTGPRRFNKKELYLEAIEFDNSFAFAYTNLSAMLSPEETVTVHLQTGPTRFNKRELYLEAIKFDNSFAFAYTNLGTQLSPDETVTVHLQTGPRKLNKKELHLEAIKLDNKYVHAYIHLGTALSPEETVQVQMHARPKTFNKKELFMEAIKLDNSCAHAYHNLGTQLSPDETVTVHLQTGPRRFNKKELYLEAIEFDNSFAFAYTNLSAMLSPKETVQVQLQTGIRTFSKKELYLETIKLDNNDALAYTNLSAMLSPKETVQVQLKTGIRSFTKEELLNWCR